MKVSEILTKINSDLDDFDDEFESWVSLRKDLNWCAIQIEKLEQLEKLKSCNNCLHFCDFDDDMYCNKDKEYLDDFSPCDYWRCN